MANKILKISRFLITTLIIAIMAIPNLAHAGEPNLPIYLQDRGTGIASSMFGTYIRQGELLFYPFFEYYHDDNIEYKPSELGYGLDKDFRGKYRASEGIIFLGYGVTDWLALELEAAIITATLETSADDTSTAPDKIKESGLGDVEGQLRWRWMEENETQPEMFSYFETVFPFQKNNTLIGTSDWEFKFGTGITKGFFWGTITLRAAVEYTMDESKFGLGEYAVEYLKRLSPTWQVYLGIEGTDDEVSIIPSVQWQVTDSVFIKFNSAFGITSKATDWAPEIGIMFSFPTI